MKLSTDELAEALEDYVDSNGLANVVDALSELCAEKAQHLRSNWGDAPRSADVVAWNRAGRVLARIVGKLSEINPGA